MNPFMKNDIIKNVNSEREERILWIEDRSNLCITIEVNIKKLIIHNWELDYLEMQLERSNIYILDQDPYYRYFEQLTEAEKELQDSAWKVIEFIYSKIDEPEIYHRSKRARVIDLASKEFNVSTPVVYKYIRKYWQGGSEKQALISNRNLCGGGGNSRKLSEIKVGRPNSQTELEIRLGGRKNKEKEGKNVTQPDKDCFKIAIKRWIRNRKLSIPKAYDQMLSDYYSERIRVDGNTFEKMLPANEIPTLNQFRYWVNKIIDEENLYLDIKKERVGLKKFDGNCRGINTSTSNVSYYPGYQMEIDATRPPFHLLNKFRTDSIGTSIVYTMADSFSKFIPAVVVTLDNPSRGTAISVLINLVQDKVDYCKQFGIDITPDEWPNSGLPKYLLADRGEFAGRLSDEIVNTLNMGVNNTPSYAGRSKPNAEQTFDLIEEELNLLPGLIESDYRERGTPDYRKGARLTLEEFTEAVIQVVIKLNNRYMKDFILSEEMIRDGVIPTPSEIFQWGKNKYPNTMKKVSTQYIKEHLMQHDVASVTREGIKYNGRVYVCDRASSEEWSTLARTKKSWNVDICFDDRNMDSIYIIDYENNTTEECFLHEKYEDYRGMSHEEIQMEAMYRNKNRQDYQDTLNGYNLRLHVGLKKITYHANKQFKKLNKTGKVNVKNSKVKRQEERLDTPMRVDRHINVDDFKKDIEVDSQSQDTNNKMAQLLSQRLKEK